MKNVHVSTAATRALLTVAAGSAAAVAVVAAPAVSASGESAVVVTVGQLEAKGFDVNVDRIGSSPLDLVTDIRNPKEQTEFRRVNAPGYHDVVPVVVRRTITVSLDCSRSPPAGITAAVVSTKRTAYLDLVRGLSPIDLGYPPPMTQRVETRSYEARVGAYAPMVLSLFRIFFGLLFLCHGTQKVFGWPVGPEAAPGSLFWFAGLIELITGVLITIGLFTRPAAFIASGEMFIAYLTQHLPNGFWPIGNGGELAVMFCWAFFLLVFAGPGAYAVDTRAGFGREVYVRGHTRRAPRRWGRRY